MKKRLFRISTTCLSRLNNSLVPLFLSLLKSSHYFLFPTSKKLIRRCKEHFHFRLLLFLLLDNSINFLLYITSIHVFINKIRILFPYVMFLDQPLWRFCRRVGLLFWLLDEDGFFSEYFWVSYYVVGTDLPIFIEICLIECLGHEHIVLFLIFSYFFHYIFGWMKH